MPTVMINEQEIEKRKDIQKILSQGLFDLGMFCESIGMNEHFLSKF